MMMMMMIQFSSLFLMCWHNSHKANYRDSTIYFQRKNVMEAENVSKLITNIITKLKLKLSSKNIKM